MVDGGGGGVDGVAMSVYWLLFTSLTYVDVLCVAANRDDDIEFNEVDNRKNVSSLGLSHSRSHFTSFIFISAQYNYPKMLR